MEDRLLLFLSLFLELAVREWPVREDPVREDPAGEYPVGSERSTSAGVETLIPVSRLRELLDTGTLATEFVTPDRAARIGWLIAPEAAASLLFDSESSPAEDPSPDTIAQQWDVACRHACRTSVTLLSFLLGRWLPRIATQSRVLSTAAQHDHWYRDWAAMPLVLAQGQFCRAC